MAILFFCDVCREACGKGCVLIQRNAVLPGEGGRWLRGISVLMWDQEEAASGRYDHVHVEKCLRLWLSRNKNTLLPAA